MSLRASVLGGAAYGVATQVGIAVFKIGGGIALAHLLAPSDFGVVAVALIVIEFGKMIQTLGLRPAIVQRGVDNEERLNTAFCIQLIVSVVLVVLICTVIAPGWAQWYNEPKILHVVQLSSVVLIIQLFGFLPLVTSQGHMRFGLINASLFVRAAVTTLASVLFAVLWRNYWAIVYGQLVGAGVWLAVLWIKTRYRPSLRFSPPMAKDLIGFGKFFFLHSVLLFFGQHLDKLLTGKILDLETLGIYYQAQKWPLMLVIMSSSAVQPVFFTAFCKKRSDVPALAAAYQQMLLRMSLLVFPACIGLFIISEDFVTHVLGSEWLPALTPLRWLAAVAMIRLLNAVTSPMIKAIGRPDLVFYLSCIANGVLLAGLLIFGYLWGLYGIIGALAMKHILMQILLFSVVRKKIGVILPRAMLSIVEALSLCLCMVPVSVAVHSMMAPGLDRMFVTAFFCGVIYMGAVCIRFRLWTLKRVEEFALGRLRRG